MNIKHHPTETTLASFATGTLDEARALAVATHLALCPQCRAVQQNFEHVGGALLDRVAPDAMASDALQQALARIGTPEPSKPARASRADGLPEPLSAYELGPWRWIGRGVQWRSVDVPIENDVRVFMLKAAPGIHLPRHRHVGSEWTCVFEGAFAHEGGRFGPGNFDEADENVEHDPRVEKGATCVCLVALQGNIMLQGFFGRLLQPFIRI